MKSRGFTLIEMTAVILIMGLLAAMTVLSLAHTAGRHRFENVCEELERADGLVRSAARQGGKSERLVYDLDNKAVLWQAADGQSIATLIHFAADDTLTLRTADEEYSSSQFVLDCSPDGYSADYCLTIDRAGDQRQMMVAGLSGRILWASDEKQVDAIFQAVAKGGINPVQGDVRIETPGDDAH